MKWWEWAILGVHGAISVCLLAYAVHLYVLLFYAWRGRRGRLPAPAPLEDAALPTVTIQVPLYNERWVARRVIRAVSALDYPREKLEIQILDDSTDETAAIVDQEVAAQRPGGLDIAVVRRPTRNDYKAGALEYGLGRAKGKFVAIFDADFVPPREWLRAVVPELAADPGLGWVQTRWGHLNAKESWLTRAQAIGIDGHFAVEQPGRLVAGWAANFNGTAGLWRKAAIQDAGGWTGDTLTEDLDLSYRAQLKGWRMGYRLDVVVPAELPAQASAVKSQQFRWAKGSIQTARKHLGRVWRSSWSLGRKLAATVHLCAYSIPLLMLASVFVSFPMLLIVSHPMPAFWLVVGSVMSLAGTTAPILVYTTSQVTLYPDGLRRVAALPILIALGMGISVNTSCAVVQALFGKSSPFVRTPKKGDAGRRHGYTLASGRIHFCELIVGVAAGVAASLYSAEGCLPVALLLGIYASGFISVALLSLQDRRQVRPSGETLPQAA